MAKVFYRKQFSDYLGEQRAINDIIVEFIADGPQPSPTPTPSITPTSTLTPTPTPTSTSTPTPTPTSTLTPTPSITPTLTSTPTTTPTNTPTTTTTPTPTLTQTPTPSSSPLPAFDPDATTYLSAVVSAGGAVSSPMSAATNNMFLALKSNGLYNTMQWFYPMLGANAGGCAINAKSPGTYDITWFGGMSFDVSGATGNSTNGYGNTGWVPSANSSIFDNGTFGCYLGVPRTGGAYGALMAAGEVNADRMMIFGDLNAAQPNIVDWGSNNAFGRINLPNTAGMLIASSTAATQNATYYNGTFYQSNGGISKTQAPTTPFYLFRREEGLYSNAQLSFAFMSSLLTGAQISTLSSIINTFQTALGRNTY